MTTGQDFCIAWQRIYLPGRGGIVELALQHLAGGLHPVCQAMNYRLDAAVLATACASLQNTVGDRRHISEVADDFSKILVFRDGNLGQGVPTSCWAMCHTEVAVKRTNSDAAILRVVTQRVIRRRPLDTSSVHASGVSHRSEIAIYRSTRSVNVF